MLVDYNLLAATCALVIKYNARSYVLYFSSGLLFLFDPAKQISYKIAYYRYKGVSEDVVLDKLIDVKAEKGRLTGQMVLYYFSEEKSESRKGNFDIPLPANL